MYAIIDDVASLMAVGSLALRVQGAGALRRGEEAELNYFVELGGGRAAVHYLFFPNAKRGAVVDDAEASKPVHWGDADSIDDLIDRWANPAKWSD